jgi:hypothetical protein
MPDEQFVPVDLPSSSQPPTPPLPDGFTDEMFAPLDLRTGPSFADELESLAGQPDIDPNAPPVQPEPVAPPAPAPAPAVPEVIEYEDGSALSIEKTPKGWRAVLDSGSGNPEVFYGKTQNEMWTNVAAAKMHATRHIRDLDRKIKLTARPEPQTPPPALAAPRPRALTADEITEIRTQLNSDPALAFDNYFQKRTGLTIDQLTALASEGRVARQELEAESVVRVFKARHPEYETLDENYKAMLGWLAKYKLNRTLNDDNQYEIITALYDRGLWTPENLDEAFEDLAQDGLLELASSSEQDQDDAPEPAAPAPPQPAAPPAQNPRIAAVRVGQRAGLGIRQRETVAVPPSAAQQPPSDEEFERMTDAEIAAQFAAVRRHVSQTRR